MDKALKQRLVGASVIIAFAVLVLPMLLSGRPEGEAPESQKIELPPRPGELSFETRRFPVSEGQGGSGAEGEGSSTPVTPRSTVNAEDPDQTGVPPPEGRRSGADVVQDPATEPVASVQIEPPVRGLASDRGTESAAAVESAEEPVEESAADIAKTVVPAPVSDGRYLVQVASLGSSENAGSLMKSLQKMGYPVVMDTVDSDVGRLNRVRVGPYPNETEAAQASARIEKEVAGVTPRVIDLEPDQTAAVTNPTDPLVRWVVQIGSFSATENAQRLVEQLRAEGMPAYRDQVTSSSSLVYRVRVGPFLEREEALRTGQQLAQRFGIDGVVMSAD